MNDKWTFSENSLHIIERSISLIPVQKFIKVKFLDFNIGTVIAPYAALLITGVCYPNC